MLASLFRLPLLLVFSGVLAGAAGDALAALPARQVLVVVLDGMRPDFVTEQNTPALFELARRGVTFRNHHAVYPSSTEVNGTAISTGAYPAHSGIAGNNEYRPHIDPLKPIHTEAMEAVRKGDELTRGGYLLRPTIAELVQKSGGRSVVSGAKPVAFLADRATRQTSVPGVNLFGGTILPVHLWTAISNRHGPFPAENASPSRNDWTTSVLVDELWGEGVPGFSFVWMNEPDASQHLSSPGSSRSLAAMRSADENLAQLLRALGSKNLLESSDILVVSDHGASTIVASVDVAKALSAAGLPAVRAFTAKPSPGEVIVVSNGGSSFVYVVGHDEQIIKRIVRFLQQWEFTGVIFTRKPLPGTFALREVRLDSIDAPDVVVSLRWTTDRNTNGIAGTIVSDTSSYGVGQGTHVSLSPFDMRATLIAAGPSFRSGIQSTLASGNVDIAPTVLWILGLRSAKSMDGRVLSEALTIKGPSLRSFEPRQIEARADFEHACWKQYLHFTEVNGVRYLDEGNGKSPSR